VEWPPEKKAIDVGSFYADSRKFRAAVGWAPRTPIAEGLSRTIAFYRENLAAYVEAPAGPPQDRP